MGDARSPTSVAKVRGTENALEAVRLRAQGHSFREIGTVLGMSGPGAHAALKRGLQDKANEIAEAAGEFRALESERLDAAAQALWAKVVAGQERAQEVWLRNRTRFATLNGLDMRPEQHEAPTTFNVITALPPEAYEVLDEEPAGELEAGEAC